MLPKKWQKVLPRDHETTNSVVTGHAVPAATVEIADDAVASVWTSSVPWYHDHQTPAPAFLADSFALAAKLRIRSATGRFPSRTAPAGFPTFFLGPTFALACGPTRTFRLASPDTSPDGLCAVEATAQPLDPALDLLDA